VDIEEKKKLHQINFDAYIQYEIIWIVFKAPLLSQTLRSFLEKKQFYYLFGQGKRHDKRNLGIWSIPKKRV